MKAKIIEVKLGKEKHRLTKNEEGIKSGCLRCSLREVCRHIGQVSGQMLCDSLIWRAFDYPKDHFPNGAHFEAKVEL